MNNLSENFQDSKNFKSEAEIPKAKTVFLFNKTSRPLISKMYFVKKLYMFGAVPLPIMRSFPLYTVPSWSCLKAVITPA
jgi:hypothetical protein